MKRLLLFIIMLQGVVFADIAPNPIIVKGIYTRDSCKIQMVSEIVTAQLYKDSSIVECVFEMYNHGDSITLEVGFPEMNFHYWSMGDFSEKDNNKDYFHINIDGNILTEEDIRFPEEIENLYKRYYSLENEREVRREAFNKTIDSIFKASNVKVRENGQIVHESRSYRRFRKVTDSIRNLYSNNNYFDTLSVLREELWRQRENEYMPWYVWNVHFARNERKTIKVTYTLPSGMGYRADYRYFKYLVSTGAGWYKNIEKADIILNIHNINMENIEEISPSNYIVDDKKRIITWNFVNLEPTIEDDIYVRYFDKKERNAYIKHKEDWKKRVKRLRRNPINWVKSLF